MQFESVESREKLISTHFWDAVFSSCCENEFFYVIRWKKFFTQFPFRQSILIIINIYQKCFIILFWPYQAIEYVNKNEYASHIPRASSCSCKRKRENVSLENWSINSS